MQRSIQFHHQNRLKMEVIGLIPCFQMVGLVPLFQKLRFISTPSKNQAGAKHELSVPKELKHSKAPRNVARYRIAKTSKQKNISRHV